MTDEDGNQKRKALALRRNAYETRWPDLEASMAELGFSPEPLSAKESVEVEGLMIRHVSVVPSRKITEMHKARESSWLQHSLERFLDLARHGQLAGSLLNWKGLLFDLQRANASDLLALLDLDGDTVIVFDRRSCSWAMLDVHEDAVEGRFFELNVSLLT